jgi:hypothetical protein
MLDGRCKAVHTMSTIESVERTQLRCEECMLTREEDDGEEEDDDELSADPKRRKTMNLYTKGREGTLDPDC